MNPLRAVARLVFLVLLVLVCGAAWVGVRGWLAKDHLESSADLLGRLQVQLEEGSTTPAQSTVRRLQSETGDADRLTNDWVWRLATHLPVLGDDLAAVHSVALSAHTAATQGLPPIAQAAADVHKLRNDGGDISPARLVIVAKRLQAPLTSAETGVAQARRQITAVDPSGLFGPVRTGVNQLDSGLQTLDLELTSLLKTDQLVLKASAAAAK